MKAPTSETVDRFRRALVIGNPVTVKLAHKEILRFVTRMTPIDLVNSFKLAGSISPTKHGIDKAPLTKAVSVECRNRKFEKFNGRDFAVLLSAMAKDNQSSDLVQSITQKLHPAEMRTTDLCMSLFALTKLGSVSDRLLMSGLEEIGTRTAQLNRINLTQILHVFSKNSAQIRKLGEAESPKIHAVLDGVTGRVSDIASELDNSGIAFALYATAEAFQSTRFPLDSPVRQEFISKLSSEVMRRNDWTERDIIGVVRALGRMNSLNTELIDLRLIPALESASLSDEQKKGLKSALETINYPLPPSLS